MEKGEELQLKGTENVFDHIIEESFPNNKKDITMNLQEAYRTPNKLDQKQNVPLPYNNQNTKI